MPTRRFSLATRASIAAASLALISSDLASQSRSADSSATRSGRLIDIGGQRIHLNCTGRGSPTVILENGAGDFSYVWSLVQPRVAEFTRVCSYDRAGYGASDPGARPRTYDQIALELHETLAVAGERPPFVLVGQSYGGLLVRAYTRRYPTQVAGLVLVDAVHEDQRVNMGGKAQRIRDFARGRTAPEPRIALDTSWLRRRQAGVRRELDSLPLPAPLDRLVPNVQDAWRHAAADSVYRMTWNAEMDWSPEDLARLHRERAGNRASRGDLPLVVMSRDVGPQPDSLAVERARLQRDLVSLSRRGEHVVATGAGHNIHLEAPSLVASVIRRVAKRGTPF